MVVGGQHAGAVVHEAVAELVLELPGEGLEAVALHYL